MKAVILAGGLGTRLRPLTYLLPKPMVPILNRPVLEHTVLWLRQSGIREVIILLYYMPKIVKKHFGDGLAFDMKITYAEANQDFATAGAVKLAASSLESPFLVISGDVICDLKIPDLMEFHSSHNGLATLALTAVQDPSPFGIVDVDTRGRVHRFAEKPVADQIFSNFVNMGVYVLQPEILDYIPAARQYYFARDLFPKLLKQDALFYGFSASSYWLDIGNIQAYKQAQQDAVNRRISLQPPYLFEGHISIGRNCQVSESVRFEGRVVIGDDCRINAGVKLADTVIGDGCTINANVRLKNCTVWTGVEIQENSEFSSIVFAANSTEI